MAHLLVSAAILLLAAPSFGQSSGGSLGGSQSTRFDEAGGYIPPETRSSWLEALRSGFPSGPVCQGPVSTCNVGDGSGCPTGFSCRCVPSCPICLDCGLGVCMPDADQSEPPICEERREDLAEALEELVARAAHCREDSDCVAVSTRTACGSGCVAFVNRRVDHRVARAIRRLDQRQCSAYVADGCPVIVPLCLPELPVCQRRRCVGMPVGRP